MGGPLVCSLTEGLDAGDSENLKVIFKFYTLGRSVKEATLGPLGAVIGHALSKEKRFRPEKTPARRLIFYGAQEILAKEAVSDAEEIKDCMKQRADEYKAVADTLRKRLGTGTLVCENPPCSDDPTVNIPDPTWVEPDEEPFTRNDFAGCVKRGANGIVLDSKCSCVSKGTCFQVPKFPLPRGGKTVKGENGSVLSNSLSTVFLY